MAEGVLERAEFWTWYEYNKEDLKHLTLEDLKMYAGVYSMLRQDDRIDIVIWLEHTKRKLQLTQNPLHDNWRRLQRYEQGCEEAA